MDWIEQLCKDPYAEARAFYGHAFPAMLEWQKRLCVAAQRSERIAAELIDDVAGQAPHMGKQEVSYALMR